MTGFDVCSRACSRETFSRRRPVATVIRQSNLRGFGVLAIASVLCCSVMAGEPTTHKPNRLVHETSPYLLQHAYNPVDWYPWGAEAFARARQENKPIFLSIGYSTCHWCHVMERESFENEDVAALMNQYFVCIKVDREERPDIDKIYMTAVQATTGSGGWPMSVWLTPDLKPFYCGTYFPPETRYGRPGFKELLQRVHDVWEANHDGVIAQANQITEALAQHATLRQPDVARSPDHATTNEEIDATPLRLGFEQFRGSYDQEHGGFGGAPKFPRPVTLNFLFRYYTRTQAGTPVPPQAGTPQRGSVQAPVLSEATKAREMALHTLRAMGEGGLFDQLGGGFHRYSIDERWLVSHFEKMLYDQAQLLGSYLDAYQITHDPFYADIARRTCDYVLRDMTGPDGGFYSAEDADSEGVEGKFYVWTREEVEKVLRGSPAPGGATGRAEDGPPTMDKDAIDIFCHCYGVEREGNWEHGNNVLHVAEPEAGKFAGERQKLLAVREKRVRPHRDDKVLTAWNGLMISALARAAQVLPESGSGLSAATVVALRPLPHSSDYLTAGQRAARYVLARRFKVGRLMRSETVPAMVEDYAFFANGLVDLYETDFDPQWLRKAIELSDTMLKLFYDPKDGGFFQTDGRDASVLVRSKEDYDGAEPSGNSMATLLLLRLAQFTDRAEYRAAAEKTLRLFGDHLHKAPHVVPQMLCALDFYLSKPKQIVIVGQPDAADTRTMLHAIHERFLPNKIVLLADDRLTPLLPYAKDMKMVDGKATAYVCVNYACQLPTTDLTQLQKSLE